jgi:hypothetical protein
MGREICVKSICNIAERALLFQTAQALCQEQGLALAAAWHEYLIMVTDRPPRAKALLTKFAASDQLAGLPLPSDDRMRLAAATIEAAMKGGARTTVQGACASAARARRRLGHGAFWRLHSRHGSNPHLDAHSGAQAGDLIRHVPQHAYARVLPSPGLPATGIPAVAAYARVLSARRGPLSSRAGDGNEAADLAAYAGRAMADRLATHAHGAGQRWKPAGLRRQTRGPACGGIFVGGARATGVRRPAVWLVAPFLFGRFIIRTFA